nr:protein kinase-like domain, concanavalin A-like lectin/glucanase domain protein [Tanacetum cinerariifolium]
MKTKHLLLVVNKTTCTLCGADDVEGGDVVWYDDCGGFVVNGGGYGVVAVVVVVRGGGDVVSVVFLGGDERRGAGGHSEEVDSGGVVGRVGESGVRDLIDRKTRTIFGFAEKRSPEKFSGGGRRWLPAAGGVAGLMGEKESVMGSLMFLGSVRLTMIFCPTMFRRMSLIELLRKPFIEIFNMTHDRPEGVVRFTNGTDEIAYKMLHKIKQYNSLLDLEREHTKSLYLKNEEDKRRRVEYVMSKILGFYKECLELGPEYATGIADEGDVT